MSNNCVIVRYGEIGTKGENRSYFEKLLIHNIKDCLRKNDVSFESIDRPRGRIIVYSNETEKAAKSIKKVFGVTSLSCAVSTKSDLETLKSASLLLAQEAGLDQSKSFRISVNRLDKELPMTSNELNIELGGFVQEKTNARVQLKGPDVDVGLDLISDQAFIFSERIQGLGGIPVGSSAGVLCYIKKKPDLLICILLMKRGCLLQIACPRELDISLARKFSYGFSLTTKIMGLREFYKEPVLAIATADTLSTYKNRKTKALWLTPLIAYDQKQIEHQLEMFKRS